MAVSRTLGSDIADFCIGNVFFDFRRCRNKRYVSIKEAAKCGRDWIIPKVRFAKITKAIMNSRFDMYPVFWTLAQK